METHAPFIGHFLPLRTIIYNSTRAASALWALALYRPPIVSESAGTPPLEPHSCNWTGCARVADLQLAERRLCLDHFFEFATRRMDSIRRVLDDRQHNRELLGDAQAFLSQVVSQTTQLATQVRLLDPALRDRLLTLSTSAADIFNHIRRAPRLPRRIACALLLGTIAPEVADRCFTVNVSQRGACLDLNFPQRAGREVTLQRLDTNRFSRAKIAWVKDAPGGRFLAGIEILDTDDFWGLGQPSGA